MFSAQLLTDAQSLVRITGKYQLPAFFAVPLLAVCSGLLVVFDEPEAPFSSLVMGQMFVGLSERLFIACSQIAVMANIDHRDVALAVGIWGLFLSIAVAIGSGNSGWIWTSVVPRVLEQVLPADSKNLTREIAGSLQIQTQNPIGSPIRDAVIQAYQVAEGLIVFTGTLFVPMASACIFLWRDIDVRERNDRHNERERGVVW